MKHFLIASLVSFTLCPSPSWGMDGNDPYLRYEDAFAGAQAPRHLKTTEMRPVQETEDGSDDDFVVVESNFPEPRELNEPPLEQRKNIFNNPLDFPEPGELNEPPLEQRKNISKVIQQGQPRISALSLGVLAKNYKVFFPFDGNYESLQQFPHGFIASIKDQHTAISIYGHALYSLSRYFNAASLETYHRICTTLLTSHNKNVKAYFPFFHNLFAVFHDNGIRLMLTESILSSVAAEADIAERVAILCRFLNPLSLTKGSESTLELPEDFPFELLGENTRSWELGRFVTKLLPQA